MQRVPGSVTVDLEVPAGHVLSQDPTGTAYPELPQQTALAVDHVIPAGGIGRRPALLQPNLPT